MANITLHEGQTQVFEDLFVNKTVRNAVAVCSRGWGKSFFAATAGIQAVNELLSLAHYVPNKNVYIIAPTYDQVTDIYYPLIAYELGMEAHCLKTSRDMGRFWFPKNVELRLVSYEAVERLRGKGAYFVVLDEASSWKKGIGLKDAWESVIEPCIITRWSPKRAKQYNAPSPGRSLTITTPMGFNYVHDMFHFEETDPLWKSYQFDYHSSPFLDPDEIERVKHKIDPLKFAREYLASFEDSGNSVFYCFDRKRHVSNELPDFHDTEDVHIGIDFNVGLQCSSVFALRGNQIHYLDEFKGHPDTENLANAIIGRYWPNYNNIGHPDCGKKTRKIYVYPDPSGRARKTSAAVGVTDFSILESKGLITRAHKKAPPIVDSVACVNRKLLTAAGQTDMYIHPRCTGVINSIERTIWLENNPDTATLDKSEGVEHFSDSVRYPIEYLYPIRAGNKVAVKGFGF